MVKYLYLFFLLPLLTLNCTYVTVIKGKGLYIENKEISIGKEVNVECYINDWKYDHNYWAKSMIPDSVYNLNDSKKWHDFVKANNIVELRGEHDCGYGAVNSFELLDTSKIFIKKIDFRQNSFKNRINLIIKDTGHVPIRVIANKDTFPAEMVITRDSIKTISTGKLKLKRRRWFSIIELPLVLLFKK